MHAIDLLTTQLSRVNQIQNDLAGQIDVQTARTRAVEGTNMPGFTLWHVARVADWAVNTMILGQPELAFDGTFSGAADPQQIQFGFGIPLDQADAIAHATTPKESAAYHDRVTAHITAWLATEPDLTAVPDMMESQPDFPGYRTDFYLDEARTFPEAKLTVAQYLTGPVIGHARGHFGELETLLGIIRSAS